MIGELEWRHIDAGKGQKLDNRTVSFHARLEHLRLEKGWSPFGLSSRAGLGKGAVADLLASTGRIPRKGTIQKLAAALDVSPEYLLGKTDVKAPLAQDKLTRPGELGSEIQSVIASMIELNGGQIALISIENSIPILGLEAGAFLIVTKGHSLETGDLVAVRVAGELCVCCVAGQSLVNLSGRGGYTLTGVSNFIDILGHIEFTGTSKLGRGLQVMAKLADNRQ